MTDRLTELRQQYLELTNQTLPQLARLRRLPVRDNHCFQRIILDNLLGRCWSEVLDRRQSAYKQLSETQLAQAIALAQQILAQPDLLHPLNQNSLRWRGKLRDGADRLSEGQQR